MPNDADGGSHHFLDNFSIKTTVNTYMIVETFTTMVCVDIKDPCVWDVERVKSAIHLETNVNKKNFFFHFSNKFSIRQHKRVFFAPLLEVDFFLSFSTDGAIGYIGVPAPKHHHL
jgi:hypothetical protein